MMDFARTLTSKSLFRYARWRMTGAPEPITLELKSGIKFIVRRDASENNDYGVAYEVFVHELYKPVQDLDPGSVKLVVDMGGNIGLSALYWLNAFPNCFVELFEPNPSHLAQITKNIALSGQAARVKVHGVAAGAHPRTVRFGSAGTATSAFGSLENGFEAPMVDVFSLLEGKRIDLLKLDVEGGEYEILGDPRFGSLDISKIVMEWHCKGGGDADRAWCEQRLQGLGFTIRPLFTDADHGMFWAIR